DDGVEEWAYCRHRADGLVDLKPIGHRGAGTTIPIGVIQAVRGKDQIPSPTRIAGRDLETGRRVVQPPIRIVDAGQIRYESSRWTSDLKIEGALSKESRARVCNSVCGVEAVPGV